MDEEEHHARRSTLDVAQASRKELEGTTLCRHVRPPCGPTAAPAPAESPLEAAKPQVDGGGAGWTRTIDRRIMSPIPEMARYLRKRSMMLVGTGFMTAKTSDGFLWLGIAPAPYLPPKASKLPHSPRKHSSRWP